MKLLSRTQFGDPILAVRAQKVPRAFLRTKQFRGLVGNMVFTMRRANGVGLAAPQIGIPLRLAVLEVEKTKTRPSVRPLALTVLVNPVIIKRSRALENDWEGCLSLDGVRGLVPRPKTITVRYLNEQGKTVSATPTGFQARVFQHEIDHLEGRVYVERMVNMKTLMTTREFEKRVLGKRGLRSH